MTESALVHKKGDIIKCLSTPCSPPSESNSEDLEVDVVSLEPLTDLPYDEKKVGAIMLECTRHLNLVKVTAENGSIY